jgi:hypothetical protein
MKTNNKKLFPVKEITFSNKPMISQYNPHQNKTSNQSHPPISIHPFQPNILFNKNY